MYPGEYTLIGIQLSLFTRKLEAQLRFQNIPFKWQFKTLERTPEFDARAGTHFIPLLMTPEKWVIHDTIALGPLLNDRFNNAPVVPESLLQRACCFILEDAFNHWLGRSCVHTRWCYPNNVAWVGIRLGANAILNKPITEPLSEEEIVQVEPMGQMGYDGFGKRICEDHGVGPEQSDKVKADFALMLKVLSAHLANNNFLLGNRPCLADFALAGACKAHYITDPEPRSWLGEHREILVSYTEGFYDNTPANTVTWPDDDAVPDSLNFLLDYLQGSYYQSARANVAAVLAGEKYYEYDYGFGITRSRTQRRYNAARLHVRDELLRIGADKNESIQSLFAGRGILEHYLED